MGCGRVENMPMGRGERVGKLVDAMGCRSESSSRSMLRFRCGLIVLAVAIAGGSPSAAEFVGEEPVAVRNAIGDGMHAYHAGDYDRAYDDLTNAIEAGTDDPRAYYFRGLAALRLGRTSEAEADFTTGADRELVTGSMRRASQSLERVQGTDRLSLERFRARARLGQLQREREHYGRRYSTIEDASGDVRRRRRPEDIRPELVAPRGRAIEDLPAAGVEEVPAPAGDAASPAKPGKKVMDEPAEMEEPAAESDDPFSDEPAPGEPMSKNKAAAKDVTDEDTAVEDDNAAAGQ